MMDSTYNPLDELPIGGASCLPTCCVN